MKQAVLTLLGVTASGTPVEKRTKKDEKFLFLNVRTEKDVYGCFAYDENVQEKMSSLGIEKNTVLNLVCEVRISKTFLVPEEQWKKMSNEQNPTLEDKYWFVITDIDYAIPKHLQERSK